jgi:general secretion pathway protein I
VSAQVGRSTRGFTLIEVVVAMAIIVVVLAALFLQISRVADTSIELRQRTLAQWIALNRLADLRLNGVPPVGQKAQGTLEYASQKWRWQSEILGTPVKEIRRIRVRSALESAPKDTWIATVDGFSGQAISPPGVGATIPWQGTPSETPPGGPPPSIPGAPTS